MKQISTKEIVDLFAYNKDSAVLVEKRPLPGRYLLHLAFIVYRVDYQGI